VFAGRPRWFPFAIGAGIVAAVAASALALMMSPSPRHVSHGSGYWHTAGIRILDDRDRPVRIAAVTWFGAESKTWVPAGLDIQPYRRIMDRVKSLGYNTIRLPYCNQMVETNPIVHRWVSKNPEFRGMHALSVIDAIVRYARVIGLKIILDDQISACESIRWKGRASISPLDEPFWYTKRYPQRAWIRDWEMLARRYKGNSAVIGFDLRNEPHTVWPRKSGGCCWSLSTYLHHGSTWGPYDGVDDQQTDWRLAAERGGDAVLKINPKLLIFVEGLQLYPQANQPHGVDSYWWGSILKQVRRYPVRLRVHHRLVYSPHEYGPQKWPYYWWWRHLTYRKLARVLDHQWGFILNHPHAMYAAPIFLGETGTCTNHSWCVSRQPGFHDRKRKVRVMHKQGAWLHLLVKYIRLHRTMGWSLWALNGTTAIDHRSTDGLLNQQWTGPASWKLQRLLATIQ
jgi:endoglucanase